MTQKSSTDRIIAIDIYQGSNSIELEYKDTGPGFPGNNLNLMFEPGYSMKPDGTGLGLALAGEAMGRIGGQIEAKQSANGAVFNITIKRTN
jgi:C4-dicarboxylate-specific signal transduction histidine kinase